MDSNASFGFYLILFTLILLAHLGLGLLFRKAGESLWKAFVPIYNYYIWTKLVGKPISWFIMMCIPILNSIIWLILAVDLAKRFGRDGFWDGIAAMVIPLAFFPWMGLSGPAYTCGFTGLHNTGDLLGIWPTLIPRALVGPGVKVDMLGGRP